MQVNDRQRRPVFKDYRDGGLTAAASVSPDLSQLPVECPATRGGSQNTPY
jgi:hypothetical protein